MGGWGRGGGRRWVVGGGVGRWLGEGGWLGGRGR